LPNIEELERQHNTDALVSLLKDGDSTIRMRAAEALGKLGDRRSVEVLIAMLKDRSDTGPVRSAAAQALGKIGDGRGTETLKAAASDRGDTASVRRVAREALARLDDAAATQASKAGNIWDSPRVKAILERPEGTPIDLSVLTKEERDAIFEDAKGMWADHPHIKDSVEWVRELREGLSKRF
jgi:HEAT repeat protein